MIDWTNRIEQDVENLIILERAEGDHRDRIRQILTDLVEDAHSSGEDAAYTDIGLALGNQGMPYRNRY